MRLIQVFCVVSGLIVAASAIPNAIEPNAVDLDGEFLLDSLSCRARTSSYLVDPVAYPRSEEIGAQARSVSKPRSLCLTRRSPDRGRYGCAQPLWLQLQGHSGHHSCQWHFHRLCVQEIEPFRDVRIPFFTRLTNRTLTTQSFACILLERQNSSFTGTLQPITSMTPPVFLSRLRNSASPKTCY